MTTVKFSEFVTGGALQVTDTIVGLRSGVNTKFNGFVANPVLQTVYNNGNASITETGSKPIYFKDASATDVASNSSLFDILSTTKGSRPQPGMTTAQFNAIVSKPEGLTAFLTNATKPRPVYVSASTVQSVAYLSDITDYLLTVTSQMGYDNGNGGILETGSKPVFFKDSSAILATSTKSILEVLSTTKGSRPYPNMTTTQRGAIATPPDGLGVFVTNASKPRLSITSSGAFQDVAYLSDITDYLLTVTSQTGYDNGNGGILETGSKPIYFRDASSSQAISNKSLFELMSSTRGARPYPLMTAAQFTAIAAKPEGLLAFLTNTNKPRPAVVSLGTVESVAYLSDIPSFPPAIELGQGEVYLGVQGSDPVAGKFTSTDNSVNIGTNVDGVVDFTITAAGAGLQPAYESGPDILLAPDKPLQISSTISDAIMNAITTPSTGGETFGDYVVIGWVFVCDQDIEVTAIQYQDSNFTNFSTPMGDIRTVGFFVKDTGVELIEENLSKTDPLVGPYRTHQMNYPLLLYAGVEYVVATVVPPGEQYNSSPNAVPAANISVTQIASLPSSITPMPLTFPTHFQDVTNTTAAPFFQYRLFAKNASAGFKNGLDGDSAFFKIVSTTLGTVPAPAMTEAQALAISNSYDSLQTWNTDVGAPFVKSNSQWKYITPMGRFFPTGATNPISSDNEYVCNSSSLVTLQMPLTAYVGSKIKVLGPGTGGFKIKLGTGQYIKVNINGNAGSTSSGGYATNIIPNGFPVSGVQIYSEIELECIVLNTIWQVTNIQGNILFQ